MRSDPDAAITARARETAEKLEVFAPNGTVEYLAEVILAALCAVERGTAAEKDEWMPTVETMPCPCCGKPVPFYNGEVCEHDPCVPLPPAEAVAGPQETNTMKHNYINGRIDMWCANCKAHGHDCMCSSPFFVTKAELEAGVRPQVAIPIRLSK